MTDRVYQLWELPLPNPCVVTAALRRWDPGPLVSLLSRSGPYPIERLQSCVDLAIEAGIVSSAKGCVPAKGVRRFVSLDRFADEFDTFIEKVRRQQVRVTPDDLRKALASFPATPFKRRLATRVMTQPGLLRWYTRMARLALPFAEHFCRRPEHYLNLARSQPFGPCQDRQEILRLLRLLSLRRPKSVLEVGTGRGGTFYLFARMADPAAKLVTVDIRLQAAEMIASFGRHRQQVTAIEARSTAQETIRRVKDFFPAGLDFLFLDGDHSYDGVSTDFQTYRPLVRPGGLIALHDIVEDNTTRYGVRTEGYAGDVPHFWREIKQSYRHEEFVSNPEQDGLGIGVLHL
jgi:predicted O-methyltransferase YrrM